ncbi:MAG: Fur family transcriptional regulator, peroxide stress response regulator [Thermoproteota archaeon]|nr:Fur family transcriptional regulator, peroxide stress response regulator [Thermoproteota archaeon]
MESKERIMEEFRRKGFRATPQRIVIAQIVLKSKDHPTAEQIYQAVKKKYPTLSPATVYQTLHLLTEIGLLQELGFSDRVSRYDPNASPHINIICRNCGKIQDYQAESIKGLWSQIIMELGFKPIGQRLDIYRHCDQCQANMHNNQVL